MRIVCATANPHKVSELARMLPNWVELVPRPSEVGDIDEDAPTLEGNAIIKANEIAQFASEWAIADDTGLEVEVLHGAPGVHSARFAGENATDADNRARLLQVLEGATNRAAQFRTVVALVSAKGDIHFVTGKCAGVIADKERGDNGFGYDSVFIPTDGDGRTFAEMSDAEKDAVSHRGRALVQVPDLLARIFGLPTP
ncbi:MAG: RdgB/HAM1 family non-canonical purine NTP pyrophosphatase [Actinobacteria bacterium]|nr:RdgB/HAM1 family non-canonical purine NTP pyrophosphatase [Actinomycetota bacterium]